MADEQYRHLTSADLEDGEIVDEVIVQRSEPHTGKVVWQETLIKLVAAQHQQIAELAKQTKIAIASCTTTQPTPSTFVADVPIAPAPYTTFKLTSYDPDTSAYAISEWLEDATKLKEELNVSDNLMIARASDALKNRGNRYCCDWRPIRRTWENFCGDLITAFPDKETPGARAFKAATLRSRNCNSFCEYGNEKLRSINRFHDKLPWEKILSMVEYGLDNAEACAALHIQKPQSERELMTIFCEFDARRTSKRLLELEGVHKYGRPNKIFRGSCFNCGRQGHQQEQCHRKKEKPKDVSKEIPCTSKVPTCNHCNKIGHNEANCWQKNGKPKKAFLLKK